MTNRKFLLKDLIKKIDWVMLQNHTGPKKLPDDKVGVAYMQNNAKQKVHLPQYKNKADHIRFKFGIKVIESLGWCAGDKIVAMSDPDDVFSFLLVRSDHQSMGRVLVKEKYSPTHSVAYRWTHPVSINRMPLTLIDFDIYEKYIHFQLPKHDDESDSVI